MTVSESAMGIYQEVEKKLIEYKANKSANLLIPPLPVKYTPGSVFVPELEVVTTISPTQADGDFYPSAGKLRLHHQALNKIARAGKVEWDTLNSGPIIGLGNGVKAPCLPGWISI